MASHLAVQAAPGPRAARHSKEVKERDGNFSTARLFLFFHRWQVKFKARCFVYSGTHLPVSQGTSKCRNGQPPCLCPLRGTEADTHHVMWACQWGDVIFPCHYYYFFSLFDLSSFQEAGIILVGFCPLCEGRKRHVGNSSRLWGSQHLGGALSLKWSPKITRTAKGEKLIRIINWFPSPNALET